MGGLDVLIRSWHKPLLPLQMNSVDFGTLIVEWSSLLIIFLFFLLFNTLCTLHLVYTSLIIWIISFKFDLKLNFLWFMNEIFICSNLCLLMVLLHIHMLQCIPLVAFMLIHPCLRYSLYNYAFLKLWHWIISWSTNFASNLCRDLILLAPLLCLLQMELLRLQWVLPFCFLCSFLPFLCLYLFPLPCRMCPYPSKEK